tara:strand:- start:25721 stop:26965 length:1245 start_codon:yes stop_codon:yes gene_type:complete
MSNLRDLIHYADLAEFESIVGAASSTCAHYNMGSNYLQWKKYGGGNSGLGDRTCWNTCHYWRAPKGTKFIRFDIWGAGGSGGGAHCCSFGMPGSSGAWTYKILCCREYGDLSGCPYDFQIAQPSCITSGGQEGQEGCKTYVRGYGLCNFCADGGSVGYSCCTHNGSWYVCGNLDYETQRHSQPGGAAHNGPAGFNLIECGPHELRCGYSIFSAGNNYTGGTWRYNWPGTGTGYGKNNNENKNLCAWDFFDDGYYNQKYGVGYGNTFGSHCQRINMNHYNYTPCYGQTMYRGRTAFTCAQWYGGDGGAHGLPGMIGSPCNQSPGDFCMTRQYTPYPGGIINDRGGYVLSRNYSNSCLEEFNCNLFPMALGASQGWDADTNNMIPGMGGNSAMVYGGTCRCGSPGASGAVIVTYYT